MESKINIFHRVKERLSGTSSISFADNFQELVRDPSFTTIQHNKESVFETFSNLWTVMKVWCHPCIQDITSVSGSSAEQKAGVS